ncbi:MAG: hypothetical protein EBR23_00645, partial [Planctomycetia bacterium]|nr:hypothetical protein [Planctomycetia bacterium]
FGDPQDLSEPLLPDDVAPPGQPRQEFTPPSGRKLPPGAKPGMLQQALYMVTELPKLDANGLGLTVLEKTVTLGLPAPTVDSPLLVTPGFVGTLTDPAAGSDVPGELFEGYIQARWLRKVGERLGVDLAVSPGWYSDLKNDSSQALRVTGHGFGAWEADENLRVVAGVINQWAMQSNTGRDQIIVIRDYRLLAGWERRPAKLGLSWRAEMGWVTGRKVEYYLSDQPWLSPSDTFLVRAGVWY